MKGVLRNLLWGILALPSIMVHAQEPANRYLFRVYEDNDAMNLFDPGSDKGYTNGTRLDFFWVPRKAPFLSPLFPKAGAGSVNTHGWSAMQMMITPDNILRRYPDPTDYPYSGGLFATRSLHSANPDRKISFQSELLLGVMGPPALAEDMQKLIHRIIAAQPPRGWDYQKSTDLLLNYQFAVSKQLANMPAGMELIGHAQVNAGTMQNGAYISTLFRWGKNMNPYFDGLIPQFSKDRQQADRWQFYITIQPGAELMITNALLDGGVFNDHPKQLQGANPYGEPGPIPTRRKLLGRLDFGAVLSHGNFGVTYTQKSTTPIYSGLQPQGLGNVSVYIAW